ncbi:ABC transporter permease [Serpentinicella sp. ANB-PHB4]|uniref:ABC transporter permease n=1 Tax=Serpentinicella sp. ANB-PHB4 TaxID=3074076 RepID=UPI0028648709|nr:ABC transporter permease [Serpentinicella sp. ANB-PHB4]MDR5658976.1 ABC transporter permease [Serpentinicella sp. ANB-PHB4]
MSRGKRFKGKMLDLILNKDLKLTLISIALGLITGGMILLVAGFNPFSAYQLMFLGMLGSSRNIAWTVVQSTPLILTGLSVAFAFRTGLFNIGVEGQFIIGALAAAMAGYLLNLPAILHIPITIIAGMLAAGLWAAIAGFLKAKFGVHEVIATIMLNWIALYLNNYFLEFDFFRRPSSESSHRIQESASIAIGWLRDIVGPAVRVNWGIGIAILTVIVISFILKRTTLGFQLRAVGYNRDAAEYGGINVNRNIVLSMAIAGILGGMGGALHVMGVSRQVSVLATMEGFGFNGIAVALIGNNTPIGVLFSAFLFGGISYGGRNMQNIGVPTEIISIVIGAIVFYIGSYRLLDIVLKKSKRSKGRNIE